MAIQDNLNATSNVEKKHDSDIALLQTTVGCSKKNFLKVEADNKTINGIDFIVNADKSITVRGTATSDATFMLFGATESNSKEITIPAASIATTGINGSGSTYRMILWGKNLESNQAANLLIDSKYNIKYKYLVYGAGIRVIAGNTVDLTFYPMIRNAKILDETFEPYAEDINGRINALQSDIESAISESQRAQDRIALFEEEISIIESNVSGNSTNIQNLRNAMDESIVRLTSNGATECLKMAIINDAEAIFESTGKGTIDISKYLASGNLIVSAFINCRESNENIPINYTGYNNVTMQLNVIGTCIDAEGIRPCDSDVSVDVLLFYVEL